LQRGELSGKHIECCVPKTVTHVAVDPGELDAVILNLITNAVYWLGQADARSRQIDFQVSVLDGGSRVRLWVHDNGPGIHEEDVEKVFWPGVTHKPGGIGMGLTVASELVAEYGGRMFTKYPGIKGGASFAFDVPVQK